MAETSRNEVDQPLDPEGSQAFRRSTGRLAGKVAVITGAARGQGEAEAHLFADEGALLVLVDLDQRVDQVADRLRGTAVAVVGDIATEDTWKCVVGKAIERWGRIDALVNNAGILGHAAILDLDVTDFRRVLDVNLIGPFLGIKHVAPVMASTGGGSIVNTSSVAGILPRAGTAAYASSKFALRGLTRTAALELGALGIRVNSIHPGGVQTTMMTDAGAGHSIDPGTALSWVPLGRAARPEEVAKLALFLCSEDSSYATGAEFVLDGGMTAGLHLRTGRHQSFTSDNT
jgi:3alpha(or 20beta)-hydroxysteroid dehydrogenase